MEIVIIFIVTTALDKGVYLVIIRNNFCQFCTKTYVVIHHLSPCDKSSDEVSQHMVSVRKKKNYTSVIIKYSLLSRALVGLKYIITVDVPAFY